MKKRFLLFILVLLLISTINPFKANAAENQLDGRNELIYQKNVLMLVWELLMERFMCLVEQVKKIN
ncbi:hypothetical protein LNK20_07985 [Bacillus safensis]|uniref:hypothetical protein n=1 Tax=Bacillus safensis TaxID=561879 RepID=UPI001FFBC224|nr:hypothetical protein [Bacillus safensis]